MQITKYSNGMDYDRWLTLSDIEKEALYLALMRVCEKEREQMESEME